MAVLYVYAVVELWNLRWLDDDVVFSVGDRAKLNNKSNYSTMSNRVNYKAWNKNSSFMPHENYYHSVNFSSFDYISLTFHRNAIDTYSYKTNLWNVWNFVSFGIDWIGSPCFIFIITWNTLRNHFFFFKKGTAIRLFVVIVFFLSSFPFFVYLAHFSFAIKVLPVYLHFRCG